MEIKETRTWSTNTVRCACVKNDLFTCGANNDYDRMLRYVEERKHPTSKDIYLVASMITQHSEDESVENVMHLLAGDAIHYSYKVEQ